jgi:hypothetical protein
VTIIILREDIPIDKDPNCGNTNVYTNNHESNECPL